MQRRKIWYRRHLFKQHFRSYKDWDKFNPSSDFKHPMRYRSDSLICRNPECPREQMPISEHEAYYYFAKRRFWKRFKLEIVSVFRFKQYGDMAKNCYICPFCGRSDVEEYREQINFLTQRARLRRNAHKQSGKRHNNPATSEKNVRH